MTTTSVSFCPGALWDLSWDTPHNATALRPHLEHKLLNQNKSGDRMIVTKPMLGLAVGGTLGLLDGLSGFLEPSLAPVMTSVITFSLAKGLVAGVAIGFFSRKVHTMAWGILAGLAIAAVLSLLVILRAGMLLGVIVVFVTQRFGKPASDVPATR